MLEHGDALHRNSRPADLIIPLRDASPTLFGASMLVLLLLTGCAVHVVDQQPVDVREDTTLTLTRIVHLLVPSASDPRLRAEVENRAEVNRITTYRRIHTLEPPDWAWGLAVLGALPFAPVGVLLALSGRVAVGLSMLAGSLLVPAGLDINSRIRHTAIVADTAVLSSTRPVVCDVRTALGALAVARSDPGSIALVDIRRHIPALVNDSNRVLHVRAVGFGEARDSVTVMTDVITALSAEQRAEVEQRSRDCDVSLGMGAQEFISVVGQPTECLAGEGQFRWYRWTYSDSTTLDVQFEHSHFTGTFHLISLAGRGASRPDRTVFGTWAHEAWPGGSVPLMSTGRFRRRMGEWWYEYYREGAPMWQRF